jgi:membrane-associated phospholipid phosphatase
LESIAMPHHPQVQIARTVQLEANLAARKSPIIGHVRKSEWIVLSFLVYASALATFMSISPVARVRILAVNASVILTYGLLINVRAVRCSSWVSILRDWLPPAFALLAYQEMGWFATPHGTHPLETRWVAWDHAVLRGGLRASIESLGPLIPAVLELSYTLVYALAPISLVTLYLHGRRERVDHFLFLFLTGVLLCYGQYPFWPSDPPRILFPNDALPTYLTAFRRFNLWMLGRGGIHTSVFPSGHVGAAFSVAAGMVAVLPERKWVGRLLTGIAALITVATVYGRYHYLADAIAGLLMACAAIAISRKLYRPKSVGECPGNC